MTLQPGTSIPSTVDLRVLKDAPVPSHILAVFDIPPSEWEPSYSPILVPIRADLHVRDFRTNIIPQSPPETPYPIPHVSTRPNCGRFVTLPVVPLHVPHAPSIPLLFLFALGLEQRSQLLCCRLLPPEVISEFPALPAMAQLMGSCAAIGSSPITSCLIRDFGKTSCSRSTRCRVRGHRTDSVDGHRGGSA
ncbi:hypothetical protein JVT61DRAFT_8400 [Boletus reticuloceps]|uniref:Uncharacterized protein n=1 Tax=Boletus reticuloceps TaxID=495285 RepID=A0A8I2YZ20_9AGAM|nr:hypothetical protein JVT61DRAFT_8400 [Boletus reticuloceps]